MLVLPHTRRPFSLKDCLWLGVLLVSGILPFLRSHSLLNSAAKVLWGPWIIYCLESQHRPHLMLEDDCHVGILDFLCHIIHSPIKDPFRTRGQFIEGYSLWSFVKGGIESQSFECSPFHSIALGDHYVRFYKSWCGFFHLLLPDDRWDAFGVCDILAKFDCWGIWYDVLSDRHIVMYLESWRN